MGIFSTKRKINVDTAVVRIIADNQLPNTIVESAIRSVFTKRKLVDSIREGIANSPFRNFEKMYKYAQSGDYFYGLPDATMLKSTDASAAIKAAIETELGHAVTIDYAYFRPLNNIHMGWKALVEDYGYNIITNEIEDLTTTVGHPVHLEDLVPIYRLDYLAMAENTALGAWERSGVEGYTPERAALNLAVLQEIIYAQSYEVDPDGPEAVKIVYTWTVPGVRSPTTGLYTTQPAVMSDNIVVSLAAYDEDKEYYQARYHFTGVAGFNVGYWTYDAEDALHPALDAIFDVGYTAPGTYFPFAIIRREGENRATPALAGTPEYLTTKKLLSYINIDFQQFSDSVHSSPDIADVEQAVLMMAVPINSQNQDEIDYLMRHFIELEGDTTFTINDALNHIATRSNGEIPNHAVQISDADFSIVISYDRIIRKSRAGSIGPIGFFTNTVASVDTGGYQIQGADVVRILRKQRSTGVYDEVRIVNPRTRYDIYGTKSVIGSGVDDLLLIPLDYSITSQMSPIVRERLYYRSLHLVVNSMVVTKTAWYQTGAFRAILVAIAVVVTIKSLGKSYKLLAAAIDAGTATALYVATLKIVLEVFVIPAAISVVAIEVVEAVGVDLAMFIAAIAAVYGGYNILKKDMVITLYGADVMLNVVNGLGKGIQKELHDIFSKLGDAVSSFNALRETQLEQLNAAQALLNINSLLDPMTFIRREPIIIFGESPTQFFNRTTHTGNVGVKSFEIIQNFVKVSLTLPTIQTSIGDSYRG